MLPQKGHPIDSQTGLPVPALPAGCMTLSKITIFIEHLLGLEKLS